MEGKTESPAQKWNRAMKLVEDALAVLGEIRQADLRKLPPVCKSAFDDTEEALCEFVEEAKGYNPFTAKGGPPEP